MKALDAVSVIEAAYRTDGCSSAWLAELARSAEAVNGTKLGALAFSYDISRRDWVDIEQAASHGLPAEFTQALLNQPGTPADGSALVHVYRTLGFAMLRSAPLPPRFASALGRVLDHFGFADAMCVNAIDPTARGCLVLVASPVKSHSKQKADLWRRLGAHVAAGARLRRSLEQLSNERVEPTERAEVIMSPNGKVEHAVGPATDGVARDRLRHALAQMHEARSRKVDPERGVAMWEALVAGRWSIVEHFERDGKRYYLAHRNDPKLAADRALTPRERQILGYAELGHANKLIAYSLGLSTSTVSTLLTRARRKLGK